MISLPYVIIIVIVFIKEDGMAGHIPFLALQIQRQWEAADMCAHFCMLQSPQQLL